MIEAVRRIPHRIPALIPTTGGRARRASPSQRHTGKGRCTRRTPEHFDANHWALLRRSPAFLRNRVVPADPAVQLLFRAERAMTARHRHDLQQMADHGRAAGQLMVQARPRIAGHAQLGRRSAAGSA